MVVVDGRADEENCVEKIFIFAWQYLILGTCGVARVVVKVSGTQVIADLRVDRQRWFENDWRLQNEGKEKDRENGRRRFVSTRGKMKYKIFLNKIQ